MFVLGLLACASFGGEESVGMVGGMIGVDCGDSGSELDSDWSDALEADGCGYSIDAVNSEGTIHLVFDAPAFVDAAQGTEVDVTYTLPDETLVFSLEVGCGFPADVCNGADTSTVDEEWTPTAGTVHLTTRPSGDDATATLTFSGVVFESGTSSTTLDTTWSVDLYMGE